MFWIALAAQLSAPQPTNRTNWFSADDVPRYLMEQGTGVWQVGIRVNVAPDGKIEDCEVEKSDGVPDLNKLTCEIVIVRAKFRPAHLADGSPAYGVYRTSVKWAVSDEPSDISKITSPDLDVTVAALPRGVKSPSLVRVMFAVDATGKASSCIAEPWPDFDKSENNPALVPVACEQILQHYTATPAKDAAGRPVASVQDALVRFSIKRR